MTATFDELAELRDPIRTQRMRHELVDLDGGHVAELHPTSKPRLANRVTSDTRRTLTGLSFSRAERELIDPVVHRLQTHWLFPDASDRRSSPAGHFAFVNLDRQAPATPANCHDLGYLLSHSRGEPFGCSTSEFATDALQRVVSEMPFRGVRVEASSITPPSPYAVPHNTTRTKIVKDLCAMLGYWWRVDPLGVFEAFPAVDPAAVAQPELRYMAPGARRPKVKAGSSVGRSDLLKAYNRWIVVAGGANAAPLVGRYELPPSAPHSVARRRYAVTKVTTVQGIPDQAAADFAAFRESLTDDSAGAYEEFDAPWDPRLDSFSVVEHARDRYLCVAFDGVVPDGPMHVTLARKAWPG